MSLVGARMAVLVVFFANGVTWASWASRLPAIRQKLDISEGALGLALMGATIGLFVAAALTSLVVARFGSRMITVTAGLGMSAILPVIGWAPSFAVLAGALAVFGLCNGALDIASNTQAVGVERLANRSMMSGFHASFSGGAIVGALGAAFLAGVGVTVEAHLVLEGIPLALLFLIAGRGLASEDDKPKTDLPVLALPTKPLLGLSALAFCVLLAEGAVFDWSSVYLRSVASAEEAVAPIGLAVFQAAMMLGRLVGDRVADRLRAERFVRLGVILGGIGLALVILFPTVVMTFVGYGMLGLGIAAAFPLTLAAAARTREVSTSSALSAVTAAGYTGFIVGPPLIGFMAELTNLRIALGVVLACLILAAFLASAVKQRGTVARER